MFISRNVNYKLCILSKSLPRLGTSFIHTGGPDQVLPAQEHFTWLPDGAVKIRETPPGVPLLNPRSSKHVSVPTYFRNVVEDLPNNLALGTKGPSGEALRWTYSQYHEDVMTVAKAFITLGLDRFHAVGIIGFNTPEWVISNVAAIHAGGFATGVYQTNSPLATQYVLQDARANIVVVEDDVQLQKILHVQDGLPHLRKIIQFKGQPSVPGVLSWKDLLEIGRSVSESIVEERLKLMAVNQCAFLIYTSGTTGNPKGTMISHDAITFISNEGRAFASHRYGEEVYVSYLPLAHLAGLGVDIYSNMGCGGCTYFPDSNALKGTLVENLKEFKPTRFIGVPRVWEKMEERLRLVGRENKGIKKIVADWAKAMATRHHDIEMTGKIDNSIGYKLAKRLVLSRVHQALGIDNVHKSYFGTGSAVLPESTRNYFKSLDMCLLDLYGSTESVGLVSSNLPFPGRYKLGTVGKPWPYSEVKLIDKNETGAGEVLYRGRSMFMGYLNQREKTLETVDDDGWLHMGDLARQDEDGYLHVVGRIKELIITSGGKNISPVNIEQEIQLQLPDIVSNVIVIGEQRNYLTCIMTLKVIVDMDTMVPSNKLEPQALAWVSAQGGGQVETVKDVLEGPGWNAVKEGIQKGIDRANDKAESRAATVRKWIVANNDFSIPGGELTPTLKLKRFTVLEMYKEQIEKMYQ